MTATVADPILLDPATLRTLPGRPATPGKSRRPTGTARPAGTGWPPTAPACCRWAALPAQWVLLLLPGPCHDGPVPVDFGNTAGEYAAYRTPFPAELFTRLAAVGVGIPGQRIADLATGTGALARGFAAAGCAVTGVDIAPEMLSEARHADTAAGLDIAYRVAPAEDTRLPGNAWDVVCAGQCWHWFDRRRAAAEARRLLVAGGAIAICYRDYVVTPGNVCAASEDLILAYNPSWALAGWTGMPPEWVAELGPAGFAGIETFSFDITVPFTHEAWRGRMRTSNGVWRSLPEAAVAAFDADLARLLSERFPHEPIMVPHRISALIARRAGC